MKHRHMSLAQINREVKKLRKEGLDNMVELYELTLVIDSLTTQK